MPRSLYSRLSRTFGTPAPPLEKQRASEEKMRHFDLFYPLQLSERTEAVSKVSKGRVLVVGGGFAGLTAAWWLAKHGSQVTVFEARDRVGGRVHTITAEGSGSLIEAGGELIGRNHPTWLRFARQFNLGLSVVTPEENYGYAGLKTILVIKGKSMNPHQQQDLFDQMTEALKTLNSDAARLAHGSTPWLPADLAKGWDMRPVSAWIDSLSHCDNLTRAAIRFELENNQSVSVDGQSYLGLLAQVRGGALTALDKPNRGPSEYWTDSEVFRCASGNDALARILRREIEGASDQNKVLLSTPVKRIDHHPDGVRVITESSEEFEGTWLVVAIPPPCCSRLEFEPALQSDPMQLGNAVKYLANVKERFWLRQKTAPSATVDSLGMLWEGTDNQNLPPERGAELSVFAGGKAATSAMNAAVPAEYFASGVERIYPGFRDRVTTSRFLNWPNEAWTRGGYSCPAPGQVTTIAPFLYQPLGRIVWAGEHTCLAFFGYMEGALQSGLHAAMLIARAEGVPEVRQRWAAGPLPPT